MEKLQSVTNSTDERFTIKCDAYDNLNASRTKLWKRYHSSCLIKNFASGFCSKGKDLQADIETQVDCSTASRWDLFRLNKSKTSTVISSGSPTMVNSQVV
ncbi:unnamed protein product [Rhizophagus irregularis]|nr:unnamed protein product [Rhizophagus irregularis]